MSVWWPILVLYCCFNTNMNSLQNFEYFEYKRIVWKKKIGTFGAGQFSLGTLVGGRPGTTTFKTRGAGGGWGVSHTRTGPGHPPVAMSHFIEHVNERGWHALKTCHPLPLQLLHRWCARTIAILQMPTLLIGAFLQYRGQGRHILSLGSQGRSASGSRAEPKASRR